MNVIVEDIKAVVESMQVDGVPYFMVGHRLEIANQLLQKDKDSVKKKQKYPLIALALDISELYSEGMWTYDLNIAILEFTEKNYTAEQRYTNVFKPILYPLYEQFLQALRDSNLFSWPLDQQYPEHTKIDRPFYGVQTTEANVKRLFNDPLDAVELIDLKLSKIEQC